MCSSDLATPPGARLRRRREVAAELDRHFDVRNRLLSVLAIDATPAPLSLDGGAPERFDTLAGLNTERTRALQWLMGEPVAFA